MGRKRERSELRERRSPTDTYAGVSDGFIEQLNLPKLPESVPQRLEDAMRKRLDAFVYQLREARKGRYVESLEIRLVREAHRAVLAANELNIADSKVYYAEFRRLVKELGYERADVGFRKTRESD